ncbi:SDR family NAD(P)-dependent oxidoreductase [Halosimplex pelagicum]|uniref:SDR family NAD(P)-dependent oxidoreductase n=1 Tax=Halosimplex pelagicum TaxID=869886 RepID=A0A7D5P709_9EURY|nr:SDR family NAD(P)-dependent oxidoreductase [Halosimplex pelagicum]
MAGSSTESLVAKCILVTGATDRLGRETAFRLAVNGASVLVYGRDRAQGEEIITTIQEHTRRRDDGNVSCGCLRDGCDDAG